MCIRNIYSFPQSNQTLLQPNVPSVQLRFNCSLVNCTDLHCLQYIKERCTSKQSIFRRKKSMMGENGVMHLYIWNDIKNS